MDKAAAARLYHMYALMQETSIIPANLPHSGEIESWRDATVLETRRRELEILNGAEETVDVEMLYDYPRDVVNFHARLAGDPEE